VHFLNNSSANFLTFFRGLFCLFYVLCISVVVVVHFSLLNRKETNSVKILCKRIFLGKKMSNNIPRKAEGGRNLLGREFFRRPFADGKYKGKLN